METLTLNISQIGGLTDNEFYHLCLSNKDLRFEKTSTGELIIMSPTGGLTSRRNSRIIFQLELWNQESQHGVVFDSSGAFKLPSGAVRAPDASWVVLDRWNALTQEEQAKFPPLCPDFIIELMSTSDNLKLLQEKMQEWIANGCHLAWLIDPESETAFIYRREGEEERVEGFDRLLSGENILPGFSLDLSELR